MYQCLGQVIHQTLLMLAFTLLFLMKGLGTKLGQHQLCAPYDIRCQGICNYQYVLCMTSGVGGSATISMCSV